ncbi:hypothetical protein TSUD_37720 [Trifolium subterraneum]|uniref:Chromo domain-containing protein n=1 Tax=Trifolium subterraneum TaxID=3900 RepID=A0A2Z6M527_TRISU|nr:hypothetical protein TSUD_37720 [Trifolium subterraneum]
MTRSQSVSELENKVDDRHAELEKKVDDHHADVQVRFDQLASQMDTKMDELRTMLGKSSNHHDSDESSGRHSSSHTPNSYATRISKVDFPRFNGKNIRDWLYKCDQFFLLDATPATFMVQDYIDQFELALTQVNLIPEHSLSIFLAGLEYHTQMHVRMFNPSSIAHAANLAKLHESSKEIIPKNTSRYTNFTKPMARTPYQTSSPNPINTNSIPNPTKPTFARTNRTYSAADMEERRTKGLCMFCDEVFTPGHQVKHRRNQLMVMELQDNDTPLLTDSPITSLSDTEDSTTSDTTFDNPQLSLQALTGVSNYQTMRISGLHDKKLLHILLDSGKAIPPLSVTGGGGHKLEAAFICRNFKWVLQQSQFTADVIVLPLVCCDLILGIQWLKSLDTYEDIFAEPTALPRARLGFDHKIPLKDGVEPFNLRPYRYSTVQKTIIDKMVQDMLSQGIIQHSNSPFASPIVLVRKNDGSWRLCVNYRKLNKATIKDIFPIPLIEDLMDELGGATIFSKLDMRSGYHQVRMATGEEHKTAFKTHNGHFEYLVMPFGLTNAPASFQSLMNHVFQPFLRKENNLFLNKSKCSFASLKVEYLGHFITKEGVSTDPSKIMVVSNWPQPQNLKQLRGFLGLAGYYRRFVKDFADALSRKTSAELLAILVNNGQTDLLGIIKASWSTDTYLQQVIHTLQANPSSYPKFSWVNGELRRRGKLLVGNVPPLKETILQWLHDSSLGGHSGRDVTAARIKSLFYWKGMNKDIHNYVRNCGVCQQSKPDLAGSPSLLQPLPVPQKIWADISMDFIEGLPNSSGKQVILVVVDRLSKYAHFISLAHPYTAEDVARIFMDNIFKLHGACVQTNPLVGHNGYLLLNGGESTSVTVNRSVAAREDTIKLLKFHLLRAQNRMKQQADKHRSDTSFEIGDHVYIKLHPYRQVSMRSTHYHKLLPKFYGPYKVLDKIGQVAYQLDLPSSSNIHNVFHVSQLKLCPNPTVVTTQHLPAEDQLFPRIPEAIVDRKMVKRGNVAATKVLVKWKDEPVEQATWEFYDVLLYQYPNFHP